MKYIWLALVPSCLALLTQEPPPPAAGTSRSPQEGWLQVRLNHFDASNTDTFPMRYYYNNEFGGPHVVIVVGGEWAISPGWTQAGLAYELAEEIGAGVFYTEHRYYGQTRPTNDTSVSSLRHLSVEQATADLAQFIQHVTSEDFDGGRYALPDTRVVLVGCSYAGSLATWTRLAYPHLVHAAFSDSGPLLAQEDFPEYLEVISEALSSQGGAACRAAVQESMAALVELLATAAGPAAVAQMFNTCAPLTAAPLDLATFFWSGITETFAYLVQYALPGDIPRACAVLNDTTVEPVQRLASWVVSQPWAQPCVEARYTAAVEQHTDTSYDSPHTTMRLWTYQTCVSFGWYQSTTSGEQPFLDAVPLEYFHQMCKDYFSNAFDEQLLHAGIERTNLLFAGLSLIPDRVVSVAGGADPWAPMGPNEAHATPNAPVYVVPNISHCRAFRPSSESETEELAQVKSRVLMHLRQYVTGRPDLLSAGASIKASVLLVAAITLLLY